MGDPVYVWARVGPGRTRRMLKSEAEERGLEIDKRPSRGFGASGVRREFMSAKEREELFLKTGRRVDDRSDMRRVFKETGLRDAEKGEADFDRFEALKQAAETNQPVDERHSLANMDLWGDYAKQKPFNYRERYEYYRQKFGLNNS